MNGLEWVRLRKPLLAERGGRATVTVLRDGNLRLNGVAQEGLGPHVSIEYSAGQRMLQITTWYGVGPYGIQIQEIGRPGYPYRWIVPCGAMLQFAGVPAVPGRTYDCEKLRDGTLYVHLGDDPADRLLIIPADPPPSLWQRLWWALTDWGHR